MIKYLYGSSRKNKIWITCFIEKNETTCYYIMVELNKDKEKSKINYILKRIGNKEQEINYKEINSEYDNDFISEAYNYAKEKGYTKRWN